MPVSEEQEEEYEALEAIYPELVKIDTELLTFTIDLASETDENQLRCVSQTLSHSQRY